MCNVYKTLEKLLFIISFKFKDGYTAGGVYNTKYWLATMFQVQTLTSQITQHEAGARN